LERKPDYRRNLDLKECWFKSQRNSFGTSLLLPSEEEVGMATEMLQLSEEDYCTW
jgi:hypothetical protein